MTAAVVSEVAESEAPPAAASGRVRPQVQDWLGRAGLVLFVVALVLWPEVLGDATRIRQWAEYLCYATIAVGLSLVWGRGGMLALGQGVFFGLGAYAMGMYLSLEQVPDGKVPAFMSLYGDQTSLPLLWKPFQSLWLTVLLSVLVPALVAGVLGWLVFRRRIRGPYFAILTQATALIFWLLLVGQLELTAGTNGLTNFTTVFGRSKYEPGTPKFLFYLAAGALVLALLAARQLQRSRFGSLLVAVRDGEERVRFLGYDPAVVKTITFALGAAVAGLAGAVAAPIIGIVAPNQFTVLPSILMVCWVAVGGRSSLWGAIAGALLVSYLKTDLSESRPDDWQYLQGLLFVVVIVAAPGGLAGLVRSGAGWIAHRFRGASPAPEPVSARVPVTEQEVPA